MNHRPQAFFIILFILLSSVSSSAARKDDEREVLKTIDALAEAGMKRDLATIERLYSDDYFHTNADGTIMTKRDVLSFYRNASGGTIESNKHDEDRIQVHGAMAVVSTRVAIKGRSAEGQAFALTYRVTYVLNKGRGSWQVTASHASLMT
jgi:ketosteroid isomerase-like protein